MSQQQLSWFARLFAGAELQQANEQLQKQEQARTEAEAALAQIKTRLDQVEGELKVRTDIMNMTSIVS